MRTLAGSRAPQASNASISANQAQRRFLIGRIEDEQGLAVRGLHTRRKPCVIFSIRQFDGSDHVVANQGRSQRIDDAAFTVYMEVISPNASCLKHRDQQCGFVFAVAIAVSRKCPLRNAPAIRQCPSR